MDLVIPSGTIIARMEGQVFTTGQFFKALQNGGLRGL